MPRTVDGVIQNSLICLSRVFVYLRLHDRGNNHRTRYVNNIKTLRNHRWRWILSEWLPWAAGRAPGTRWGRGRREGGAGRGAACPATPEPRPACPTPTAPLVPATHCNTHHTPTVATIRYTPRFKVPMLWHERPSLLSWVRPGLLSVPRIIFTILYPMKPI